MLSRLATTTTLMRSRACPSIIAKAYFATKKPPGTDPLLVIRDECHKRKLCDEFGLRRPGVHWVFSVAVTPDDPSQVCILKKIHNFAIGSQIRNFKSRRYSTDDLLTSFYFLTLLTHPLLSPTISHLIYVQSESNAFRLMALILS